MGQNCPRNLFDGDLVGIAEIARAGKRRRALHQQFQAADEIIHEAEASGLRTVTVNGDRVAAQRLDDEVRNDASVILQHSRSIGVENASDFDLQSIKAVIVEYQRFGGPLAFVVTSPRTYRIDMADIGFRLRMNFRVPINLAGGSLKNSGSVLPGELQHVHSADDAGFHRSDRIALVVPRRGRTREIVNAVDIGIELERFAHVMFNESEIRMIEQRPDVAHRSGEEVVDADHWIAALQQRIAKMRADEAGATRHERSATKPRAGEVVDL